MPKKPTKRGSQPSKALGNKWGIGAGLVNLGTSLLRDGDVANSRECFVESLNIFAEIRDPHAVAEALHGMASASRSAAYSARIWGAASSLMEVTATAVPGNRRAELEGGCACAEQRSWGRKPSILPGRRVERCRWMTRFNTPWQIHAPARPLGAVADREDGQQAEDRGPVDDHPDQLKPPVVDGRQHRHDDDAEEHEQDLAVQEVVGREARRGGGGSGSPCRPSRSRGSPLRWS